MKNKALVLARIETIRQKVRNIKYLINTNGSFDDVTKAFEETFEILDNAEELVSIESDPFKTNQLI